MNARALAESQSLPDTSRQTSSGFAIDAKAASERRNQHRVLVVGDKFRGFSEGKAAITISQLRGLLELPTGLIFCERTILVPGQGLSDQDIEDILDRARTTPHRDRLDFSLWRNVPARADGAFSHKHRKKNTLISAPRRVEEDLYRLELLIDEDCELMDDHQTGQHLQGMLLVEASRQAFLAVTEAFILPWGGEKAYFVFNSLTVEFSRFMFPVAACLNFRVRERDYSGKYPRFSVEIQIEQAGRQTAEVRCGYTVMPDQRIAEVEQALALQALDWQFSAVSDVLSADSSAESVMSKPLIAE